MSIMVDMTRASHGSKV